MDRYRVTLEVDIVAETPLDAEAIVYAEIIGQHRRLTLYGVELMESEVCDTSTADQQ